VASKDAVKFTFHLYGIIPVVLRRPSDAFFWSRGYEAFSLFAAGKRSSLKIPVASQSALCSSSVGILKPFTILSSVKNLIRAFDAKSSLASGPFAASQ
jgi:hypothetical protein